MSNDDHQFIWALENGQPYHEVDDEWANYHGLCGSTHTPGDANCPMVTSIRYGELSSEELFGELNAARKWLIRARQEEVEAHNRIAMIREWIKLKGYQ